jgi:hypothetical protein
MSQDEPLEPEDAGEGNGAADAANAAPVSFIRSRRVLLAASVAGCVLVLVALAALLRPRPHAEPGPAEDPASSDPVTADLPDEKLVPPVAPPVWTASRPAAGAGIAILIRADSAYDAGDFAAARDLYLDLLLSECNLDGAGDAVVRWAHGRLALALARLARAGEARLIDEPPLTFRGGLR